MSGKRIYQILRIGLGGLFVISGIIKTMDLNSFSETINAFAVLPYELSMPAAVFLSLAEITFGSGLVFDIRGSLSGVSILIFCFILVLSYALAMGYDIDCGCFGPNDPEAKAFASIKTSLARDLGLAAVAGYLYVWRFLAGITPVPIFKSSKGE